jgi:hypothetical protein
MRVVAGAAGAMGCGSRGSAGRQGPSQVVLFAHEGPLDPLASASTQALPIPLWPPGDDRHFPFQSHRYPWARCEWKQEAQPVVSDYGRHSVRLLLASSDQAMTTDGEVQPPNAEIGSSVSRQLLPPLGPLVVGAAVCWRPGIG